jgi:UDP-N-acetylmuramate--alanine ligase
VTRDPADIARGLAPARAARKIGTGQRIHVIGAGGAAASGACLLAAGAGAIVTACETAAGGPYERAVTEADITLEGRHDARHIHGPGGPIVDRVAVTKAITSVRPDHPELEAARAAGIVPESVQQVIADAVATLGRRLIGITGTHGKSTTTGWVLHALVEAGGDPSGFVGALLPGVLAGTRSPATARIGHGPDAVVEADEYAGNFDPYRPAIGAVVSLEWDHPDIFVDASEVVDAVESWVRGFDGGGEQPVLVGNVGDPGVRDLLVRLADWEGRLTAVRLARPGDDRDAPAEFHSRAGAARGITARIEGRDADGSSLAIDGLPGHPALAADVRLAGDHMAVDGLVAFAVAVEAGVEAGRAAASLGTFRGVGRRLELKGDVGGVVVLDDYGHHPTAIAATLSAVRRRYPGRRTWAVYEPLTYHRTAAMLPEFADVLATAERVAIVDIWAVRDLDTTIVSAADLAAATAARGTPAIATGTPEESAARLAGLVEPGDVVLVMGGGRSYIVAEELVELLGQADSATGSAVSTASSSEAGTA